ncbi:MAG: MBOAT family protein [Oscillospiraceae bacterium]|nr:MBOAT family protein [Oscillospiraceae bacterium]
MVFSSILFLFKFLPITLLIYYIVPKKLKNLVLLVASLFFYSWGEPKYFPLMLACILVNYVAALLIDKHREKRTFIGWMIGLAVFFDLGCLVFFKYSDFFISNINSLLGTAIPLLKLTLPLGISFYTFQTMAYTIDVYRGKVKAERNIINLAAFVVLFPQLIAGPIVLYDDVAAALRDHRITKQHLLDGIRLFIFGLGKKVLIANNVGALWTQVNELGFQNISTPLAWLGIIAFSLQIYFDFSGYSLMAIGLGKLMGFDFPTNFNFPYISRSFTEFWRRWHITLGSWFREYLYIPLGGNRKGYARTVINLLITWAATGFWHGANWNFLVWGLLFFVLISIEKRWLLKYLDKGKVWPHIYTLFILVLSWALFDITDMTNLGLFFTRLFDFTGGTDWIYYLRNYAASILVAILFCIPLVQKAYDKVKNCLILDLLILGVILFLSISYLVDSTYNPFLYFRF